MNESNAKEEVLLEAIVGTLIDDTVNTSKTVREIAYYCSDRVYLTYEFDNDAVFPQLVIDVEQLVSEIKMPTTQFMVSVKAYVSMNKSASGNDYPQTRLIRLTSRVVFLLHNKQDSLNDEVSSKNLRCRIIQHFHTSKDDILTDKVYGKNIIFSVICDNEII